MKLDDYVAVSGLPGVYKMVANRNNGLIIEDLDTGKRKFAATRKHQFTPLASIGIYSEGPEETLELKEVFRSMLEKVETVPPVSHTTDTKSLITYFREVMPTFDEERVKLSDIKKVVKWFTFLNNKELLSLEDEVEETAEEKEPEEAETSEEKVESEEKIKATSAPGTEEVE